MMRGKLQVTAAREAQEFAFYLSPSLPCLWVPFLFPAQLGCLLGAGPGNAEERQAGQIPVD